MGEEKYIVGIDLGTTNSVVTTVDRTDLTGKTVIKHIPVRQVTGPHTVEELDVLPSCIYILDESELELGLSLTPVEQKNAVSVGEYARIRGTQVPGRVISSAKSWLAHAGVDRNAPILPWGAENCKLRKKFSPVEAQAAFLEHMRWSWEKKMADEKVSFSDQKVIIGVPASFDPVSRELTLQAARSIGIGSPVLIEEPQAAFYAWLYKKGRDWFREISSGDSIVVVDVGGGTTDFSLIAVKGENRMVSLERIAVSRHILLGGDNMDMAIASKLEANIGAGNDLSGELSGEQDGKSGQSTRRAPRLDAFAWNSLVARAREAKEQLLAENGPEEVRFTVSGAGRNVIGSSISFILRRRELEHFLLQGFFEMEPEDVKYEATGLVEWGLPYAKNPSITAHLLTFLEKTGLKPGFVLFNGGVMKAGIFRRRIVDSIERRFGVRPRVLESQDPDRAVAIGAAYYGYASEGDGVLVRSASPRAYFIGVSLKGAPHIEKKMCLLPDGVEEGRWVEIDPGLEVLTNRDVVFSAWQKTASCRGKTYNAGEIIEEEESEFEKLSPLRARLNFGKDRRTRTVPVRIRARLTGAGGLEMSCLSARTGHEWKLNFDLSPHVEEKKEKIIREPFFSLRNSLASLLSSLPERGLLARLEELTGIERSEWSLEETRMLFDFLHPLAGLRKTTARHEKEWLQMAGYVMRPGWGAPGDVNRIAALKTLINEGPVHPRAREVRLAWWIFIRRIACGFEKKDSIFLTKLAMEGLMKATRIVKGRPVPDFRDAEQVELWRLLASLEFLPVEEKIRLGDLLASYIEGDDTPSVIFWALMRLGARTLIRAPLDMVVPASRIEPWVRAILSVSWKNEPLRALAAVNLARITHDRMLEVDDSIRREVEERLGGHAGEAELENILSGAVSPQRMFVRELMGESLPPGLLLS